jgi:DNA-binding NarL/FixJ family response regulator
MKKTKILWIGYNQNQTNIYHKFLKMLQSYHIEVIMTTDSLTGLEKALKESFDAILIQETLYATPKPKNPTYPKDKKNATNTYNTIKQIKEQTSNTTILVLSDASKGEPSEFLKAGAKYVINAHTIKPFDLLEKIPPPQGYKTPYY